MEVTKDGRGGGDQTRKGGRRCSIAPYDFRTRRAGPSQLGVGVGVGVGVLIGVAIGIGMRDRGVGVDLASTGGRPRPMALLGVADGFSSGIPLNFRGLGR